MNNINYDDNAMKESRDVVQDAIADLIPKCFNRQQLVEELEWAIACALEARGYEGANVQVGLYNL